MCYLASMLIIVGLVVPVAEAADQATYVDELLRIADGADDPKPRVRAAAIDNLGRLGPVRLGDRTPEVVGALAAVLKNSGNNQKPESDYISLHVVEALAKFGTSARSALPDMTRIVGRDVALTNATNEAMATISKADDKK